MGLVGSGHERDRDDRASRARASPPAHRGGAFARAADAGPAGSVRRTLVTSPVAWPEREASGASTSSRSGAMLAASGIAKRGDPWLTARSRTEASPWRKPRCAAAETSGTLLAHVPHGDGHEACRRGEGTSPRQHLVQHDAERIEVGLSGNRLPEGLLGRDVVGRAEHASGDRQPLLGERARDAEVGDLGATFVPISTFWGLTSRCTIRARARRRAHARSRSRRRSPGARRAVPRGGSGP